MQKKKKYLTIASLPSEIEIIKPLISDIGLLFYFFAYYISIMYIQKYLIKGLIISISEGNDAIVKYFFFFCIKIPTKNDFFTFTLLN
jgi:hypothetical protein